MTADQSTLRQKFKEIAAERLRALNQAVLALEDGDADAGTVDVTMREIHTLKGESRMLGLGAVNRVAHRTEDLLLHAKRTGRLQDPEWLQHIYAGFDLLAELLEETGEAVESPEEGRAAAFDANAQSLLASEGSAPSDASPPASKPGAVVVTSAPSSPSPPDKPESATRESGAGRGGPSQRVTRDTVEEVTRTAGEMGILLAHLRRFADDATEVHERTRDFMAARIGAGENVGTMRAISNEMESLLRGMRDVGFDVSIRQSRLQDTIERMRLAAVATLFDRFPRTVRDLARELGKEARLVTAGGQVGADQQVLDLLGDPLVHLLRNAVDHGLEPPETREAAGKRRRGTVRLDARQAGRFVEILVSDDGRGIEPTAVAEAAVRKGLLSEADVGRMSETEILRQLFRPAFSTRTDVSDVSGRGVGLDVVKSTVEDFGGSVRIESEVGQGTTFVLRLPVSIALVDALVIDLEHALYAVPSAYVAHILEVDEGRIEAVGRQGAIELEDGTRAPVRDLVALLGFPAVARTNGERIRLVVVTDGDRRLALRVPAFVGELALVQEALDPFLKGVGLVTGTAMLDGGRRVVMLNGVQLLELIHAPETTQSTAVPREETARPARHRTALVIEDSDLTRSMLVTTLEEAGWRVLEAVDGQVGLELFGAEETDLVITDLDMPRLDGFEVIRQVRQGDRHADVPIVVFTTRTDDDAKRCAGEAGADVYLLKSSFSADEVLGTLDRLLAGADANREGDR